MDLCLIVLLSASLSHAQVETQTDTLLASAVERTGVVEVQKSIEEIKRVVAADRDSAPAYETLARLYMQVGTPQSRLEAEHAIKRALRLDPNNISYQLTFGDLYWERGHWSRMSDYLEGVIRKHPDSGRAAFRLGLHALKEFLKYQDMVNTEELTIRFTDWAERDRDKAIYLLGRSIDLAPDLREAYYHLGVAYQESRDPQRLVDLAMRLLDRFPEDKDGLLFAGLGCQTLGQYARADSLYQRALATMAPDERGIMEAVGDIASDREAEQIAFASLSVGGEWSDSPERGRFWKQRDPLFLTGFNERRMAHYGRVAYANLRFTKHYTGTPGWQTDMGRSWIKFGRYLGRQTLTSLRETWFYEGFSLTFALGDGLDDWVFTVLASCDPARGRSAGAIASPRHRRKWNVEDFFARPSGPAFLPAPFAYQSSSEIFAETTPRYVDPYRARRYSLPHQAAFFREGDSLRAEVAYAIPRDRLTPDHSGQYRLTSGTFVFDREWNDLVRKEQMVALSAPTTASANSGARSLREAHLVGYRSMTVAPDANHLVVEVVDETGLNIGSFREQGPYEYGPGLQISPLLLATHIEPVGNRVDSRQDLNISPNPIRTFGKQERVHVYLEMYNLTRDGFGQTRYAMAYEIGKPKEKLDPGLFQAISTSEHGQLSVESEEERVGQGALMQTYKVRYVLPNRRAIEAEYRNILGRTESRTTRITSEYEGSREEDFTYFAIDLGDVPAGIYELKVEIRDHISGDLTEGSTVFRIVD